MKNPTIQKESQWDKRFFDLARLVSSWSEDNSRKVGAVIVADTKEILSTGYNGLRRGVSSDVESRHSKEDGEKYFWFEHAERNAIFNSARNGVPLRGATLYATLFPCADCARAIVQSGITTVKTYPFPKNDPSYSRSFEVSEQILREGGVTLSYFRL